MLKLIAQVFLTGVLCGMKLLLPYALNDLSASYCGTATPPMYTGGIVYIPDCASCASYVIADYYAFDPCPAPEDATLQMTWDAVVGPGTIYVPCLCCRC